jgi:hypothetical protein
MSLTSGVRQSSLAPLQEVESSFHETLQEAKDIYKCSGLFMMQACLRDYNWGCEAGGDDGELDKCSRCSERWCLLPHEAAAAMRVNVNLTYGASSRTQW